MKLSKIIKKIIIVLCCPIELPVGIFKNYWIEEPLWLIILECIIVTAIVLGLTILFTGKL